MTTASASQGAPGTTGATTDSPGLTTADVHLRLERDGANALPEPAHESTWAMFARQLTHLLALLLWVGAGLALLAGMPELSAAIVVIVLLNALFAFVQDYRADRSTQELRALLPATARVVRNGAESDVPVQDLVVDDVVLLTGGDRIAADMLLVEAGRFAVDESMVTGESGAVARGVGQPVLAGTFVMSGEARAVVSATGPRTTIASIASMTAHAERHTSPLTLQLNRVVRVVAVIAALTGVLLGDRVAAAGSAGRRGLPVRCRRLRRVGAGRAAADRDAVAGARCPADGQAARARAPPRRRRDPRRDHLHLHRQDGHPDAEPDECGRGRDTCRHGQRARARLRPRRHPERRAGGPGPGPGRRGDRAGVRLRTRRAASGRLDGRR